MPGLTFYGASIHHPKFAELSAETKWTFAELAIDFMDANNLELPDGFIHPDLLLHCSMGKQEATRALNELEVIGIVQKSDDPEGWTITNFNRRAERFRPTAKETELPNWGQRTLHDIEKRRLKHADNSARSRQRNKGLAEDSDDASKTELPDK